MKRFNKKNDVVYVLDFTGNLLKKTTFEGAIKFTGVSKKSIYESIRKNTLIHSKYIFSKTPQTVIRSTWVHNPLFSDVPPEIVNEFMVQQRGWEKSSDESEEDGYKERERLKRWNLILEKTRNNKIKKKKEWDEIKEKQKFIKSDNSPDSPYVKENKSSVIADLKEDLLNNVVDEVLQNKLIDMILPFAKSFFKSLLKKFNNDQTRIMSFQDKETGLVCLLDMETKNIQSFEVSGITKDNLLTIDPQDIRRGNIQHILKTIIKKYNLI